MSPFSRSSPIAREDLRILRELDAFPVVDDLDLVAPGIAELEPGRRGHGNADFDELLAHRLLVVDDEAEVALEIRAAASSRVRAQ